MPRTYGKVKQTRLAFTPIASSSPGIEHSPGGSAHRLANVRYEHPSRASVSRGRLRIDDYPSFERKARRSSPSPADSSSSAVLSTPGKSSHVKTTEDEQQIKTEASENNMKLSEASSPCPIPSRSIKVEHVSSDEDTIHVPNRRQRPKAVFVTENGSSSDSDSVVPPNQRRAPQEKPIKEEFSPTRNLRSRRAPNRVDDEESDLEKPRSAARASEDATRSSPRKRARSSGLHLSDLGSPETSGADEIVTRPTSRRLKRGAAANTVFVVKDDSEESDSDIVVTSPAKRRRRDSGSEVPRTPRQTLEQDRLDLEEDLKALQDSAVTKTRTRGRLADSTRIRRLKQLEVLRRRRAGERAKSITESDVEAEAKPEGSEDNEIQSVRQDLDGESSKGAESSDVESAVPDNEDLDRYEDDFVLQDDDGEIGAPTDLYDMPFEFTRHRYKLPKEYFRDVVEWMVHNKLNPAFPRQDAVYQTAFMKLEDEVRGRTGSQLISPAWNSDFRRALMARPQIEVTLFPITEGHVCDACNKSGHPASFDIKLYGKPYSLDNLEPLSEDESDEESEREDTMDRDRDGYPIPDENTRFFLGRHCKAKATMAHTLIHWRFHLNEWVIDYLTRQGVFSDARILERSHWSQKRQTKYANEVVDMMVESGEVQKLWRDFHITLKAAREVKEARW
ncbi:hypothetical protein VTN00DRAFT_2679 [Thermoascus crustaceus]|uniref:uncharacterized protein n=1 Tax=Thermoascus crustaceus TaxID=5088 RepID=UPI003742D6D9